MNQDEIIKKIKDEIAEKVRPALVMDGGNIEFVEFKDGILKVKLLGHCHGCPMAGITLKNAVCEVLQDSIPEIKEVIAIDFDPEDIDDNLEI